MDNQTLRAVETLQFLTSKIFNDNSSVYKTCSCCEEETKEPHYCDFCGRAFCVECVDDNLSDQGYEIDNPIYVCLDCYETKGE